MAEQVLVGATVSADTKGAVDSIGSLKKQLREAQNDVQALSDKFGATSQQAINAAKKAAELKDRIGDAKALTDAYNPDAKFKGFAQTLQGVVGGFTAVQGALGLVGVESDQVEKTLLKVQSAMALSQGLNTILESVDAFKNFSKQIGLTSAAQKIYTFVMYGTAAATKATDAATKAASTSMRILRGIIATLGIGALIAGVTFLISKISSWVGSTDSAKEANDKLNEAIDQQNKLFEKNRKALQNARQDAITEAKIKGASAEELFRINQAYGQKDIDLTKSNAAEKLRTLQDFEKKNLEVVYVNGQKRVRGDEQQIEQYKKLSKELEDANNTKNDAIRQSDVDAQNEQLRIADEGRAKSKQNSEKTKAEQQKNREERKQAEKDAAKNIQDLESEVFLQSIKDETQRALVKLSIDKENQINEINASKATAEQKAKQIALIEQKFQQDKDAIELDASEKRKEKEKSDAEEAATKLKERFDLENGIRIAAIKDEFEKKKAELLFQEEQEKADLEKKKTDGLLSEEAYQQGLLNIRDKYAKATTEVVEKQADDEKKIQQARKSAQLELYDTIAQGFGALSGLFGQGTAASKAFALSEIAISSATGFARGLDIAQASAKAAGPGAAFAFPLFYAQQALAVINIIGKARNILKQVKGGSGSAPSTSAPSVGGGSSAPISPALPIQATLTQLNQGSINQLGSATNRAYVVESDVTNSQERIKRINRAARLN